MSREIKFRAWHKALEEYVKDHEWMHYGVQVVCGEISSDFHIIEQFTGLHDSQGKEIYEGDIMHDPDDNENPFSVFWCDQSAQWQTACKESESCSIFEMTEALVEFAPSCEIIGNLHENPELLEQPPTP